MGGIYFGGGFFAEYSVGIPSTGVHASIHLVGCTDSGPGVQNCADSGPGMTGCLDSGPGVVNELDV